MSGTSSSYDLQITMADSFIDNYKAKHQHPVNKLCHVIGIPMIIASWPMFFFNWRWALGMFVIGYCNSSVMPSKVISRPSFKIRFTF